MTTCQWCTTAKTIFLQTLKTQLSLSFQSIRTELASEWKWAQPMCISWIVFITAVSCDLTCCSNSKLLLKNTCLDCAIQRCICLFVFFTTDTSISFMEHCNFSNADICGMSYCKKGLAKGWTRMSFAPGKPFTDHTNLHKMDGKSITLF